MDRFQKHPLAMIAIAVVGISLSSIFVRLSQAPSAVTAAYRLLWTVVLMLPTVLGGKLRPQFRQVSPRLGILSCLSGLFLAIHFVLWFESLKHTTVAASTTIVCTEVIWVALGFCLLLKGRLSWKEVAAIGVTLAGSVLIAWTDQGTGLHLKGDLLALLAAVAVAAYTLLGRVVRSSLSTGVYTFMVYCACAAVLLGVCLIQGYSLFAYGFSAPLVGLLLAVFSTLLGHSIFSWCLKYFSPAFVSASKLCEPVVAGLLAAVLFSEIPTLWQLVGSALVLGGVLAYSWAQARQAGK